MYRKLFRTALVCLCVALATISCRKEESTLSTFLINGSKSYYFEPDETIKVYYTQKRIARVDVVSRPEGWDISVQNGYLAVHAPQSGGAQSGTIEVKGTSVADIVTKRTFDVTIATATNLSEEGTANCYIAPSEGRYAFDGTRIGDNTFDFATAKLLWAAPADVVNSIQTRDGHISFSTKGEGNAVIAIYNNKGAILWSWHIWAADFDAEATAQTFADGTIVMSRNLGATAEATDDDQTAWASCGTYYQWGRKDPMRGTLSSKVAKPVYGPEDYTPIVAKNTYTSLGNTIQNPYIFYGTGGGDWGTGYDNYYNNWNMEATGELSGMYAISKTIYDPSPVGYSTYPGNATSGFTYN
ncbi:MAG: hypothetical protein IKA60_02080, partial [Rikenellaceae bacterium]|nr:hypothetical protein [Rikenellaceae bacterium]